MKRNERDIWKDLEGIESKDRSKLEGSLTLGKKTRKREKKQEPEQTYEYNSEELDLEQALSNISLPSYKNERPVSELEGVQITAKDLVKSSALFANLNTLLIGDTGGGKTQIEKDAASLFNNDIFFLTGRNDPDLMNVFEELNLGKLKRGEIERESEIRELTDNIKKPAYIIDEINRCAPEVQNQFFNLLDGYVSIRGKEYKLGLGRTPVDLSSANVGKEFSGISQMGKALRNRLHVVINVDYNYHGPGDSFEFIKERNAPELKRNEGNDKRDEIFYIQDYLDEQETCIEHMLLSNYIEHGLNVMEEGGERKLKRDTNWPNSVPNHGKGGLDNLMAPATPRGAQATIRLAKTLEMMSSYKHPDLELGEEVDHGQSFFEAFRHVAQYKSLTNRSVVNADYQGIEAKAVDQAVQTMSREYREYIADENGYKDKFVELLERYNQTGEVPRDYLSEEYANSVRWKYILEKERVLGPTADLILPELEGEGYDQTERFE